MAIALAFVPLNAFPVFSSKTFREHLTTHWDSLGDMKRDKGLDDDAAFVYENDKYQLFVSKMPEPIPWGDLEGPCQATLFGRTLKPNCDFRNTISL